MKTCVNCGKPITGRGNSAKRCFDCLEINIRKESKNRTSELLRSDGEKNARKLNSFKNIAHALQGSSCIICGWSINSLINGGCVVHHIIPVSEGGKSDPKTNAAVLCPNCHAYAHNGLLTKKGLKLAAQKATQEKVRINVKIIDFVRSKGSSAV